MTAPVVRAWLAIYGRVAPETYAEFDSSTLLAVQIKADFESAYGDSPTEWDEVSYEVNGHMPDITQAIAEAYASRRHASTYDLLVEAQTWLAGPSRRAAG